MTKIFLKTNTFCKMGLKPVPPPPEKKATTSKVPNILLFPNVVQFQR